MRTLNRRLVLALAAPGVLLGLPAHAQQAAGGAATTAGQISPNPVPPAAPSTDSQGSQAQAATPAAAPASSEGTQQQTATPATAPGADQPAPSADTTPTLSSGQATGVEEIVVTARRKEENIQAVPSAITALSAKDLADMHIQNFGDVGKTVPNLNVEQQFGSASSPFFILRGATTGTLRFESDAPVGLYIDGVYIGRPAGTAFDMADLCRLEVMRGPQGTLFGRNSVGGAINFVTCGPSGQFDYHFETGIGNYGERRVKASIDTPEVAGLSAKFTYLHTQNNGYVNNAAPGVVTNFAPPFGQITSAKDFGNDNTNAFGAAVRYTGVSNLKLDYRLDYTDKVSSQLAPQVLAIYNPAVGGLLGSLGAIPPSTSRLGTVPLDLMSETTLRVFGNSLTADYEINDHLHVKSITSYRQFSESANGNDIDGNALSAGGVPFDYIAALQARSQHQVSQEFQLIGNYKKFDWITGLFYFREAGNDNNPVFIGTAFPPGSTYFPGVTNGSILGVPNDYFAGANYSVANSSKAVYSHGTYHITDALDLSGGLRYTQDRREENIIESGSLVNSVGWAKGNHVDKDVSLNYAFTPDIRAYAKYSSGYLSGGILGGVQFQPETINSFEVGLKSDWLEHRVRANVALFHNNINNLQLLAFNPQAGSFLQNGGSDKQNGAELELNVVPIDGLTLTGSYGYLQDDIASGVRSFAPKHTLSLGAQYDAKRFSNGSHLSFRVNANWTSDRYGLQCPAGSTETATGCTNLASANYAVDNSVIMKANWQLGAQVALAEIPTGHGTKTTISLWGANLLNTHQLEFARDLGNGTVVGTFQAPRTFGLNVSIDGI